MRQGILLPSLCWWLASGNLLGQPLEAPAPGGRSPDGKYVVMIVAQGKGSEEYPPPLLVIQRRGDGATLGLDQASSYASYEGALRPVNTVALWRRDSAFVAVKTRGTKTSTSVLLFRVTPNKAEAVKLPDLWHAIRGRMGLTDPGRFYFEAPLRWTKAGELVVEVTGNTKNSDTADAPEASYRYQVVVDSETAKMSKVVELKKGRRLP